MTLLFRRRGVKTWPIGIIPWMMGSFRLLIRSFLLTAFRKPLCTRSPKSRCHHRSDLHKVQKQRRVVCQSASGFFETMQVLFTPVAEEYEKAKCSAQPEDILRAINAEEQVYFQLLTEHCNDCTLFFCRSDGSSIETVLHELMNRKAEQTVEFFSHIYGKAPNADAIRLLMGSQFWYFRQLLDQHMEEGRMLTCLQTVLDFTNAGWRQLCDTLQ